MRDILEITIDISNIVQDKAEITGRNIKDLIQIKIKNLSETDQSKQIDSENIIEDIIPLHCDIDNGQVYDINTGKVVKEL